MITGNTGTDVLLNFRGIILMANVAVCLVPDQKAWPDSAGWSGHKKNPSRRARRANKEGQPQGYMNRLILFERVALERNFVNQHELLNRSHIP